MDVEQAVHQIELRMARNMAFARGALAVGVVLIGAIQFYAILEIKDIRSAAHQVRENETAIAIMKADVENLKRVCQPPR